MTKDHTEWMLAIEAFKAVEFLGFQVDAGLILPADHPIVKQYPSQFVPASAGLAAVNARRFQITRDQEAAQAANLAAQRALIIKQGTRPLASDDALAEAAKASVRANSDLELVHDRDTGVVIGARPKHRPGDRVVIGARPKHRPGDPAPVAMTSGYVRMEE